MTQAGRMGWRAWPLALLLAALALAWALGLHRQVSLAALAEHRDALQALVAAHPLPAGVLFVSAYAGIVALALPVGPWLTMAGGLLFGRWIGLGLAVTAGTIGASLLFLAVRSALAPAMARRAGPVIRRLLPDLQRDGFWMLLSIRLLPLIPFPGGSIAAALVDMRLLPFAAATALGIVPGTAIYAGIGAGLDAVLAQGGQPDLGVLFSTQLLLPLAGLAVLSIAAAWWRRNH